MVGVRIDLRVNGRTVRIQNETDVRKLRAYLDDLLSWIARAPEITSESPASPYDEPEQATTNNLFGQEINATQIRKRGPNPIAGSRAIDYIVRALQIRESLPTSMREAPTIDDLYPSVLTLGWKGSDEPGKAKRVLIVTARQNKELVTVNQGRLLLTDKGKQHLKDENDADIF